MENISFFRGVQAIFGLFFILESFDLLGILKRIKWFDRHRVDKLLMLFGGVLLFMYGIFGGLPNLFG